MASDTIVEVTMSKLQCRSYLFSFQFVPFEFQMEKLKRLNLNLEEEQLLELVMLL